MDRLAPPYDRPTAGWILSAYIGPIIESCHYNGLLLTIKYDQLPHISAVITGRCMRYGRSDDNTHTPAFNGPLSGTTRVSRYQKGKTNLDFTAARDSEWQCHQLGRMQVCTSLQTDNHASTPPLSFYRPDALPAAQPTASEHWKHSDDNTCGEMTSQNLWSRCGYNLA